jgi:hypothetical protein
LNIFFKAAPDALDKHASNNFFLEKFCKRIGYKGELQPNDITLPLLIRHQLMMVPLKI